METRYDIQAMRLAESSFSWPSERELQLELQLEMHERRELKVTLLVGDR